MWRNGSLSRRRCADGLEHMCSQGRLFATPITGTSNKFRPRQRRLRGPTHGKWEESLLQHSSRRFQLAAESKVVHCRCYSISPTDERLYGHASLYALMFTRACNWLVRKFHCTFQATWRVWPDRFFLSRMRRKNGLVHETSEREGLVHTVCACALISRHSGISEYLRLFIRHNHILSG